MSVDASRLTASEPDLADSAWEVRYPQSPKLTPRLYHFEANSRFRCDSAYGSFMFNDAAWKTDGEHFEVAIKGDAAIWKASGVFDADSIRGVIVTDGQEFVFEGRRVDKATYDLPVESSEVVVTAKLRTYVTGSSPEAEHFDEYLKAGNDQQPVDRWEIYGFIFEVVSPQEFKGQFVTSHHDGVLASGDPFKMASVGNEYRIRLFKEQIGLKGFGICSVYLRMKDASDKSPLGSPRLGITLLSR